MKVHVHRKRCCGIWNSAKIWAMMTLRKYVLSLCLCILCTTVHTQHLLAYMCSYCHCYTCRISCMYVHVLSIVHVLLTQLVGHYLEVEIHWTFGK